MYNGNVGVDVAVVVFIVITPRSIDSQCYGSFLVVLLVQNVGVAVVDDQTIASYVR